MVSIPPYLPVESDYHPTHPDLFLIHFAKGDFASSLITQQDFKANQKICTIENILPGTKAYSSVQVLPDPPISSTQDVASVRHIELNSDLLYVNHSCDPNVVFDVSVVGHWQVRALKDLPKGTVMTFAYFSTEWFMDQPFDCLCGTSRCLKRITGAREIKAEILESYFINAHIKALKAHQTAAFKSKLAETNSSTLANASTVETH